MKTATFVNIVFFVSFVFCHGQVLQKTNNSNIKFPNKIDDIETAAEIKKLVDSIDKKRFESFTVNESLNFDEPYCEELANTVQAKPWTKADFDGNGYTDLLIVGKDYNHSIVVILDFGKNNFAVKNLTGYYFRDCTFPVVQDIEEQPVITYYSMGYLPLAKTLVYKFGDFIELNNSPETYKIEKIEYKNSGCFGICPSFGLTVNSNRKATFKPIYNNKKKKGTYRGKIENNQFDELIELLNYIDFPMLKNDYYVTWTDDQTSFLTVTYDGGKVKKIRDYGLTGTFGLSRVYKILFAFTENQNWK